MRFMEEPPLNPDLMTCPHCGASNELETTHTNSAVINVIPVIKLSQKQKKLSFMACTIQYG